MKKHIRFRVWETNSSSVNTLTIMTAKEYKEYMDKWLSDDWVWDNYDEEWVRVEDIENNDNRYRYTDNPLGDEWCSLEKETATYTTEHGDKIVAVSIYGHD